MDSKEDNFSAELAKILTGSSNNATPEFEDTITLSAYNHGSYGYVSPNTVTLPNVHWSNSSLTVSGTHTSSITGTSAPWATYAPTTASTRISLSGEDADIEVNGWSLVDAVKRIEQRLGLFQPNSELEKEWEELKALGEKYRQLEQHIKDKQATFDRIKAMPPPELE